MGKGGSNPPPAPDPHETAAAEARFNRPDTYSPSGSGVRHGFTNAQGEFQQGTAPDGFQSAVRYLENPHERAIREALEPASVALTERVIQDNIAGMPDAARVRDRSDVASDLFNRTFSLMAPAIDKSNERLLDNLQARGLPVGSEAFNNAYGDQQERTQDTIMRLAMDSNLNAGQEQSRQFGLDQAQRSGSIAELVAAMGGGYNPPSSSPSGNTSPVNYGGLVSQEYQGKLAAHQTKQQQDTATAAAVASLGAAMLKCTAQAKDIHGRVDIDQVAVILQNLPLYGWNYKPGQAPHGDHGGQHIGPTSEQFNRLTGLGRDDRIDVIDYLGVVAAALQSALHRIAALEAIVDRDQTAAASLTPVRLN